MNDLGTLNIMEHFATARPHANDTPKRTYGQLKAAFPFVEIKETPSSLAPVSFILIIINIPKLEVTAIGQEMNDDFEIKIRAIRAYYNIWNKPTDS